MSKIITFFNLMMRPRDWYVTLVTKCPSLIKNDRKYIESLPGVGHKTANVFLSNIYNEPAIAVDTHVARVSKRLGLAYENDSVIEIEKKLMKKIPKDRWSRMHHQLVLFGRYRCTSLKPKCDDCEIREYCIYKK